jgi:hypothetical protein
VFANGARSTDVTLRGYDVNDEVKIKPVALARLVRIDPPVLNASRAPAPPSQFAVESATQEGSASGCLLVCIAPLVSDAAVRQFLQDAVAGAAAFVDRRFRDGIAAGEIPTDFPVVARTNQVLDLSRGLTMRAQMGTPRKLLLNDAEEAVDFLLLM